MRLSVAYQTGTSIGTFRGVGMDLDGDFDVFGGVSSKQTLFARQAAPPSIQSSNPAGLLLLLLGGIVTLMGVAYYSGEFSFDPNKSWIITLITGPLLLLMGFITLLSDHAEKERLREQELREWAQQWICLQCGARFVLKCDEDSKLIEDAKNAQFNEDENAN